MVTILLKTIPLTTNATIANLVTTPSSKILHISTHGLLLKDKTIKNPMLKLVLLFAGANQNQKKSTISALRLSALDLHNTELIVLSACQSGLGEIHQAEGVVGLPKALLQAGAKNVIMSLWTVSNVESAKLMDYFYGNISKGLSYSKALQQAKLSMINKNAPLLLECICFKWIIGEIMPKIIIGTLLFFSLLLLAENDKKPVDEGDKIVHKEDTIKGSKDVNNTFESKKQLNLMAINTTK